MAQYVQLRNRGLKSMGKLTITRVHTSESLEPKSLEKISKKLNLKTGFAPLRVAQWNFRRPPQIEIRICETLRRTDELTEEK